MKVDSSPDSYIGSVAGGPQKAAERPNAGAEAAGGGMPEHEVAGFALVLSLFAAVSGAQSHRVNGAPPCTKTGACPAPAPATAPDCGIGRVYDARTKTCVLPVSPNAGPIPPIHHPRVVVPPTPAGQPPASASPGR